MPDPKVEALWSTCDALRERVAALEAELECYHRTLSDNERLCHELVERAERAEQERDEAAALVARLREALEDIVDFELRIPAYRDETWPHVKEFGQRMTIAVQVIRQHARAALALAEPGREAGDASTG